MFSMKSYRKGRYNRKNKSYHRVKIESNDDLDDEKIIEIKKNSKKKKKKNKTVRFSDVVEEKTITINKENDNIEPEKLWDIDFEFEILK